MRNEQHDELDRTLNAALATYSAREPWTGIEQRILARLPQEKERNVWLGWAVPVAILSGLLTMMVYWSRPDSRSISAPDPDLVSRTDWKRDAPLRPATAAKASPLRAITRSPRRRLAVSRTFPLPSLPTAEEYAVMRLAAFSPETLQKAQGWQERSKSLVSVEPIEIPALASDPEWRTD